MTIETRGSKKGVSNKINTRKKHDLEPQVWTLYLQGLTQRKISEKLGIAQTTISNWITGRIKENEKFNNEIAKQYVHVELERLDMLMEICMKDVGRLVETTLTWSKNEEGERDYELIEKYIDRVDVAIVDRILKIQERRARYLNLDAGTTAETLGKTLEQLILASFKQPEQLGEVVDAEVVAEYPTPSEEIMIIEEDEDGE